MFYYNEVNEEALIYAINFAFRRMIETDIPCLTSIWQIYSALGTALLDDPQRLNEQPFDLNHWVIYLGLIGFCNVIITTGRGWISYD